MGDSSVVAPPLDPVSLSLGMSVPVHDRPLEFVYQADW